MKRTLAFGIALSLTASLAFAASVEDIVAKHIKSMGGKDAMGKITSLKRTGTLTLSGMFGEFSGTFEEVMIPGKKSYSSMDLGVFMEKSAWDGSTAWKNNNMEGMKTLEGDELEEIQSRASISNVADLFEESGASAFTLVEDPADAKHHVLAIARNDLQFHLDKESGLLKRLNAAYDDPQMGETTMLVTFGEYEAFEGVQLPKTQKVVIGDDEIVLEFTFEKTEVNGDVDETLFAKPTS